VAAGATAGYDPRRLADATSAATAPLAAFAADLARHLPASGPEHVAAVTALLLAAVPVLALFAAAAWQLGALIADREATAL
jgi:hypothetical protein